MAEPLRMQVKMKDITVAVKLSSIIPSAKLLEADEELASVSKYYQE